MHNLLILLMLAIGLDMPVASISWKSDISQSDGQYRLVLSGQIKDGCYTHPMATKYVGTELRIDSTETVWPVGEPVESYRPSQYKGEEVIAGTYTITQDLQFAGPGQHTLSGTVVWTCCAGDECFMPEEYAFSQSVKVGEGVAVVQAAAGTADDTGSGAGGKGLWGLILEAVLWGLLMLLTPCVFPMVPMTVSFFLKGSENAAAGRFKALMYGLFIVVLYTLPICLIIGITWLVGGSGVTADIFNWLSTHWLPNILFFIIFMIFAASFFGAFELVLPSRWTNSADRNSNRKGLLGVFFLALTLVLVSFSCTGPIVGTVLIKSTQGEFWTPMLTMLAFSIAFALPFTLLAFFPSVLKKLPKSGGWLNSVKVVLGFIEIALGFKFLSTADQTYHWGLLDREVYLAIWIACFSLLALYLMGKIRFRNDSPLEYISVKRLVLIIADLAFVIYLIPGMWGAPLKALSGYLPPMETQDFVLSAYTPLQMQTADTEPAKTIAMPHGLRAYTSLDEALSAAQDEGKKVFVDVTGHGCVNCREMEARVWSDPRVLQLLRDQYVIAALYVDDKTRLPEERWMTTASGKVLKDVGRVNSHIALERFGVNAQPNYILLDADGRQLAGPRGYDLDIEAFIDFLTL